MIASLRAILATVAVAALSSGIAITSYAGGSSTEPTAHVIEITGFKFIPESVVVKAGDTVTWLNKDIAPHTATADDLSFDTGELKLNESGTITITEDQTISYFCKFHPSMKATLAWE